MESNERQSAGPECEKAEAEVQSPPQFVAEALRQEEALSLLLADQKIVSAQLALQLAESEYKRLIDMVGAAHGAAPGSVVNAKDGVISKRM